MPLSYCCNVSRLGSHGCELMRSLKATRQQQSELRTEKWLLYSIFEHLDKLRCDWVRHRHLSLLGGCSSNSSQAIQTGSTSLTKLFANSNTGSNQHRRENENSARTFGEAQLFCFHPLTLLWDVRGKRNNLTQLHLSIIDTKCFDED